MYQKNDLIVYSVRGVCRVEDVGIPNISSMKVDVPYYTLSPVYSPGLIYIPVDTDVFMRPVISKKTALDLIYRLPKIDGEICKSKNLAMLCQQYNELLNAHNCETLFRMLKGIEMKKKICGKLWQTDEKYLKRAQELLYGELASALEIPLDDVAPYIKKIVESLHG